MGGLFLLGNREGVPEMGNIAERHIFMVTKVVLPRNVEVCFVTIYRSFNALHCPTYGVFGSVYSCQRTGDGNNQIKLFCLYCLKYTAWLSLGYFVVGYRLVIGSLY